jgi:hypothetical protein
MKNTIYLSTALNLLNDEQLIDILNSSRENNLIRNVTGVLLYSDGTFIQVLEGDNGDVDAIFSKIEADRRHKNIFTLSNASINERNLPDWSMGFSTFKADKVTELKGYLKSIDGLSSKNDTSAATVIIKTFIKTNNLIITF